MNPKQLVDHFGTQVAAAKALGVKQPSIAQWMSDGEIPIIRQYQIEMATNGALRADLPANREAAA